MHETTTLLNRILGKSRTWRCNVLGCQNDVSFSGEICAGCKFDSAEFKREQELLDEWFKKFADSNYIGALFKTPIPKIPQAEEYIFNYLKEILHKRDQRISDIVHKHYYKIF